MGFLFAALAFGLAGMAGSFTAVVRQLREARRRTDWLDTLEPGKTPRIVTDRYLREGWREVAAMGIGEPTDEERDVLTNDTTRPISLSAFGFGYRSTRPVLVWQEPPAPLDTGVLRDSVLTMIDRRNHTGETRRSIVQGRADFFRSVDSILAAGGFSRPSSNRRFRDFGEWHRSVSERFPVHP